MKWNKVKVNRVLSIIQIVSLFILPILAILIFFLELPDFTGLDLLYFYLFLFEGLFIVPVIIVTSSILIAISKKKKQILLLCTSLVWFSVTIYILETRVITL